MPEFTFDSRNLDAFGRLRVSQPYTLFDSKLAVDERADLWDEVTTGTGASAAHNANESSVSLSVSGTTEGSIARQSHYRQNYQPGKSQLVTLTAILGTTGTGNTKRLGQFDDQNGFFFQYDSTGLSVGVRSYVSGAVVNTVVGQSSFNKSGNITFLDPDAAQIFVIDYQWLGVGVVRFGIEREDGALSWLHHLKNPNNVTAVYMTSPTLPVRYEISNDGSGAADSLVQICSQVSSEAGVEFSGSTRAVDRGITALTTASNTTLYPLIAIRLKSTHWRAAYVDIVSWEVFTSDAVSYRAALLRNPTFAGTAPTYATDPATESPIEVDLPSNATTLSAEGVLLGSSYNKVGTTAASAGASGKTTGVPIQFGVTPAGVSDVIVLAAQNLSANATPFYGSITVREIV